ncbi:MAG: hypothetical protein OXH99_03695 [Bryobacterales bacterium]|nr:hypothetical protein [Bryobacterales bacterium]
MAGIGFIVGFLLSFRGVRSAVWILAICVWFRRDPLDALLWLGVALAGVLAWNLLWGAAGHAGPEKLGRQTGVLD